VTLNARPRTSDMDPRLLQPNPWNSNIVSPDNEAKLDESVRRLGMYKPIVVRELDDGSLQILGGEHRWQSAIRLKLPSIPVCNLGRIDDQRAKEISLIDNSRYGTDDALQLAALLEDLGSPDDLASFMPFSESEFASLTAALTVELDQLDITPADETPTLPAERQIQTHQIMRFKVPVADAGWVTDLIGRTMKTQKFNDDDSLANAGDALVHLLKGAA